MCSRSATAKATVSKKTVSICTGNSLTSLPLSYSTTFVHFKLLERILPCCLVQWASSEPAHNPWAPRMSRAKGLCESDCNLGALGWWWGTAAQSVTVRLDNTSLWPNYLRSTANTTNFWFLISHVLERLFFCLFSAAAAAEIRGKIPFFYLLTEKYQAISYSCSSTASCLLIQRKFLILYHSEQMNKKKNRSDVGTDSLN